MQLKDLPANYIQWLPVYEQHLENDLEKSNLTIDLYKQYKKHLGAVRFKILKEAQMLVVPQRVKELLAFGERSLLSPVIPVYKLSSRIGLDKVLKAILLPGKYKAQIRELNISP
jgi:hypothetical protein